MASDRSGIPSTARIPAASEPAPSSTQTSPYHRHGRNRRPAHRSDPVRSCGRGSRSIILGWRGGSGESLRGPVLGSAAPIKTRAKTGQDIHHVLHEIVLHLGFIDHN